MNSFTALRKTPWWVLICSVLLVGDLFWRYADLRRHSRSLGAAQRFKVLDRRGEGKESCVTIVEQKTPVLAECDFDGDGKVDSIDFFWHGKSMLTLVIEDGSMEGGRSLTY